MDQKQLKAIMKLFEESKIDEIELEEGDNYIRLVKNKPSTEPRYEYLAQNVPRTVSDEKIEVVPQKNNDVNINCNNIKAPLVGTYYESATPSSPPFIKVGDVVSKGDIICILESMKVMNEITSPYSGVVKEILVKNQSMVEYEQTLVIIE